MPLRRLDVPRSVALLALCLVLVPALLWLVTVERTRPPSPEDAAAERARVESSAEYAETLDWCRWQFAMRTCEEAAYRVVAGEAPPTIDLTPEPWDVSTLAVLAMAGTSLAIGVVWRPGHGFRALLRRSATVAAGSWLVAAEVGVSWWWGLSLVNTSRGLGAPVPEDTWSFVRYGALLVGLAGLAGAAVGVLVRGPFRLVVAASGAAVVVGSVLLVADPVDPWLPPVNVEAFLVGEAGYDGPVPEECDSPDDLGAMSVQPHLRVLVPVPACPREVSHGRTAASGYLAAGAGLLWVVAATTSVATRPRPSPPGA